MRLARLALYLTPFAVTPLALLPASCSSSSEPAQQPPVDAAPPPSDAGDLDVDMRPPTPAAWDQPVMRPDDGTAQSSRAACTYKRGDMPAATLGTSVPVDKDIPIQNVVVLMMENHSFDNYFGHLNKYAGRTDIESAPDTASNPDKAGGTSGSHPWHHAPHKCIADINHEWVGTHTEINGGKMDGFFEANDGYGPGYMLPDAAPPDALSGDRAMEWYDETDLPFYYKLASTFAIADHYFASNPGETWSNRRFLYAATTLGVIDESFPNLSAFPFPDDDVSILDELTKRHVDWRVYTDGLPGVGTLYGTGAARRWSDYLPNVPNATAEEFMSEAAAGTLPPVAFLDPDIGSDSPTQNDEHPPAQIQIGEKFVSDVVHALFTSPQWAHMALFIVWDEHGGYYDHLAPPKACVPDDIAPIVPAGTSTYSGFDTYGVRVPFIVVSPYAKAGYVGHATYDHASIVRFIETKFKMPALTRRDANADPLVDLFDFSKASFAAPPSIDAPPVDMAEVSYCTAAYKKPM